MSLSINADLYWRQKQATIDWFHNQGRNDINYTIGTLSCSTMIPCLVIALWLGEESGFDEKLIAKIKKLITFYGYSQILGVPKNYPEELIQFLET